VTSFTTLSSSRETLLSSQTSTTSSPLKERIEVWQNPQIGNQIKSKEPSMEMLSSLQALSMTRLVMELPRCWATRGRQAWREKILSLSLRHQPLLQQAQQCSQTTSQICQRSRRLSWIHCHLSRPIVTVWCSTWMRLWSITSSIRTIASSSWDLAACSSLKLWLSTMKSSSSLPLCKSMLIRS